MGTSILKAAEISLFCLERGQTDEKQMFPLGDERSAVFLLQIPPRERRIS